MINKQKIRQKLFKFDKEFLTWQNIFMAVAFVLAINWVYSSVKAIDRNYQLQKRVNLKKYQLKVLELKTKNLEYEKEYLKTIEYQDLALRQYLNKIGKGEKVFVVAPNQKWIKEQKAIFNKDQIKKPKLSNFQKWIELLSGNARRKIVE